DALPHRPRRRRLPPRGLLRKNRPTSPGSARAHPPCPAARSLRMRLARRSWSCLASLVPLAIAAAFAPGARATDGANRKAGETLRDRVLVKVSARATSRVRVADGRTGIPELDLALAAIGARGAKPVFHDPPRGRASPAAAERIGIDRWLHVDLGGERKDLAEVVAKLKALRCVEGAGTD